MIYIDEHIYIYRIELMVIEINRLSNITHTCNGQINKNIDIKKYIRMIEYKGIAQI